MSHEQDNSKTEEKDGLYYHKCRLKTETKTKNSKSGGYGYDM